MFQFFFVLPKTKNDRDMVNGHKPNCEVKKTGVLRSYHIKKSP